MSGTVLHEAFVHAMINQAANDLQDYFTDEDSRRLIDLVVNVSLEYITNSDVQTVPDAIRAAYEDETAAELLELLES